MAQQTDLSVKVGAALEFIRSKTSFQPDIAIILGTGLGRIAKEIELELEMPYTEIPGFPHSTVESHAGKFIFGRLSGRKVIAMQGRFHLYEGWSMEEITLPVRVMKLLGAKSLIISNACGTMNPQFCKSRIMLIEDHINLLGGNPLIGYVKEEFGPRFVDMSEPYSRRLISLAEEIALENKIPLYKGVYAALPGPNLETRAEYRMLRLLGTDVVGMSTVPENIVARQMGMEVLGLSIMTDECYPDALKPTDISEIIAAAEKAEPDLSLLVREIVKKI